MGSFPVYQLIVTLIFQCYTLVPDKNIECYLCFLSAQQTLSIIQQWTAGLQESTLLIQASPETESSDPSQLRLFLWNTVYPLALRSRKKIPVVLGECLSIYTVMPRGKKRHINNNNFLSKSPPKRTDWRLKMGTCWGIFMTFICHMRELKANGLWVHAGK